MAHVIVIGTNVAGLAAAFRLAREGKHTVLVLEPHRGTSSLPDDGLVAPQADCILHPQGPSLSLLLQARDALRTFTLDIMGASGMPIPWSTDGVMVLSADEVETRTFTDKAVEHSRQNLRALVADPLAMMEMEPLVSKSLMGGIFLPDDSAIDPLQYARALEKGIRECGGEIQRGVQIEGLHEVGGLIRGVKTSETTLGSDFVVLCDGEPTHAILASCGVHLPMTYRQQTMARILPEKATPNRVLCTSGLSLIPASSGVLLSRPVTHPVKSQKPLLGDLHALTAQAHNICPSLTDNPVEEVMAWNTATTADGTPYVGRLAQLDGLVLAVGLAHRTTLLSAMIGEWIQLALNGESLPDMAREVAPDRSKNTPLNPEENPEAPASEGGPIFIPPL